MLEYSTYFAVSVKCDNEAGVAEAERQVNAYLYGHSRVVGHIGTGDHRVAIQVCTSGRCDAKVPLAEDGIDHNVAFAHELADEIQQVQNWAKGQRDRLRSGLLGTSHCFPHLLDCTAWVHAHWLR